MKQIKLEANKRAIAVVAHPDDEIIWMGGLILDHPQVDWTIFSLCRSSDSDRKPKFDRVVRHIRAHGIITDLDDEHDLSLEACQKEAFALLLKEIGEERYDYVFTHGANGEYGHDRHVAAHMAVKQFLEYKNKKPEAVFYFSYERADRDEHPLVDPLPDSDILVELDEDTYKEKRRIVAEMYGYPYDGIDVGLCAKVEAFRV